MKLTCFLLFAAFLHVSARGLAQEITLSEKNVPLEKIFKAIERQTGYAFFFNYSWIDQARPVTIEAKKVSLRQALDLCFRDQPFSYAIVGKTIVVQHLFPPGAPRSAPHPAPSPIDVHGRVTDSTGKPLEATTIAVKGSNRITTTAGNGEFYLAGVDNNALLIITHIGYERQEIRLKGQTELNISLKISTDQLGVVSVILSTGYQNIPKERATGSFGIVTDKDLAQRPDFNLVDRLEGMVSGMLVNAGPQDRSLTLNHDQFTIRGVSTIMSDTKPLIVLDGFPTELDLVNINPADIEKVTVLKDAAATSIWGVRAANGVLVIDTKKGAYGTAATVSFSSTLKTTGRPRLNAVPSANSLQFLSLEKELVDKGILPAPSSPLFLSAPPTPQGSALYLQFKNGQINQQQLEEGINSLQHLDVRDQYQHYLLRSPFSQQYNLSVSGGSNQMRNFLSASYSDEYPAAIGDYGRRITVNFNNETRLSRQLSFTAESFLSLLQQKNNGIGITALLPGYKSVTPYDQLVDATGKGVNFAFQYPGKILDSLQNNGFIPWRYNFLDELTNADNTYHSWTYRLNLGLKYEIVPTLSVQAKYMLEKSHGENRMYYNSQTYMARELINLFTTVDTHVNGIPNGGILTLSPSEQNNNTLRGQLNFSPNFNADHRLDIVAGAEIRETLLTGNSSQAYGYDDRLLIAGTVNYTQLYNTVAGNQTIPLLQSYTDHRDRYTSLFGNFTYTFRRKYSLSGSARKDDSNLFGASKQYHAIPLWSVGALWRILEEPFVRASWVSLLNFRTTYGYNGNVNKQTSPYLVTQAGNSNNPYNNLPFASVFNPANPLLRWEKVGAFNVALDYGLFNNRLTGSIDLYWKKSTDLLGPVNINPTYGFTSLLTNRLEMTNHGLDMEIAGTIIPGKIFSWKATANFSYNTNKVTKAYFQENTTYYFVTGGNPVTGKPLNSVYTYRFAGLDQYGTAMIYTGKGEKVAADLNTFDETDLQSVVYKGVSVAPWFGGMTQIFQYRDFVLSTLFTWQFGNKFIRPTISDYYTIPYSRNGHADIAKRWEKPGDEGTTNVPAVDPVHLSYYRYQKSDIFVENAGYVRWKLLTLSYHLPDRFFRNAFVRGINCSATGQNLAIWTVNKRGIDPDYIPNNNGILPPSKSFVFSVKADF
ncbi:SusC/RagA family TonB-linked outer membrane protein [Flavitalea flava]